MFDRIPASGKEGRVKITPESGAPYFAKLEMADEPSVPGTALNKASLLSDATAALVGLNNTATPNDVFSILAKAWGVYPSYYVWRKSHIVQEPAESTTAADAVVISSDDTSVLHAVEYGASVSVSDGNIVIDNAQTVQASYSTYTNLNAIPAGYYFRSVYTGRVFRKTASSAATRRSAAGYPVSITGCHEITVGPRVETDMSFVVSPDALAYPPETPDGWDYTQLGQIGKALTRLTSVSYTGTGSAGAGNETSVFLTFIPRAFFIRPIGSGKFLTFMYAFAVLDSSKSIALTDQYLYRSSASAGTMGILTIQQTTGGYFIKLRGSSAAEQMNVSGHDYEFIAIG